MWFPRALFTPRHSTVALLAGGLAAGVLGFALGTDRSSPPPAAAMLAPAAVGQNDPPSPALPAGASDATGRKLVGRESSADRDEALAATLAAIAIREPARAVACALAEPNSFLRQNLLSAALRGWASVAPEAAADWCLQRSLGERGTDLGVVLRAAARDPAAALRLAARLVRDDPALAHDHGCSLVFALAQRGDFADAATFAANGDAAQRDAWLSTAYSVWTEHQPQAAAAAALALAAPAAREASLAAVVARWSTLDPHGLAEFSLGLPPDPTRRLALGTALVAWANQDFAAASDWINRLEPAAELDPGVAAVATQPPLVARRPEIAVDWAESIFNPDLRRQTLSRIVAEWASTDPQSARRYVETSPRLDAADRPPLLASLTVPAAGR